jgi:hypothetical protein
VVFALLVPYRLDYAAHVLGGASATVLAGIVLSRWWRGAPVVLGSIALVLGAAVIGEVTVFGADPDIVDLANSVAGVAIGGAIELRWPPEDLPAPTAAAVWGPLLVAAFMLRYLWASGPNA